MITLFVLLLAICVIVMVALAIGGLIVVAWPLALILIVGITTDVLVLRHLLVKKK